jgi:hypothetical protein
VRHFVSLSLAIGLVGVSACTGSDGADGPARPGAPNGGSTIDAGGPGTGAPTCEVVDVSASPLLRMPASYVRNAILDVFGVASNLDVPGEERAGPFVANRAVPVPEVAVEAIRDEAARVAGEVRARLPDLLPCAAVSADAACARAFLDRALPRLYRRRVPAEEAAQWMTIFELAREDRPEAEATEIFAEAVGLWVQAWLQSPSFLYAVEEGETTAGAVSGVGRRTNRELASRLAAFLWDSVPDDALLAVAQAGRLTAPDELEQQARRMVEDPRFDRVLHTFHRQLLEVDPLDPGDKAPELGFTEALARSMERELDRFVVDVFRSDAPTVETLLAADYTVVDDVLAEFYGLPTPSTAGRVASARGGILTMAWPLAVHSSELNPSIVDRGKLVRENLLCTPLPEPPPNANSTDDAPSDLSRHERMQARLSSDDCRGCHRLMDPIGVTFDAFDAIGRARTPPEGDRGELLSTDDVDGVVAGSRELVETLAGSAQVKQCLARQWLRFAGARVETERDTCVEAEVYARFEASGFDLRELVVAVATSPVLTHVRLPEARP